MANWTFEPPVSTPTLFTDDGDADVTQHALVFAVGQGLKPGPR